MELTGILLMSSSMLFLMLLVVIFIAMHFKMWAERKDVLYHQKIEELKDSIEQTQGLFKNEVSKILAEVTKILK